MAATEQFSALYQTNSHVAQRYAAVAMEGAQRILRVQMEATREVFDQSAGKWREAVSRMDPAQSMQWPSLMQVQMQLAMEMTRSSIEGASRVYGEYVRTLQEQGRALSEAFHEAHEQGHNLAEQAVRSNERAAEEVGRRAAETVSQQAGQVGGITSAAAGQTDEQRRRVIAKP
jgi:hypothetical protein